MQQGDQGFTQALETTRGVVQKILIRRTKRTQDWNTGKPIVELPPRSIHVVDVELSEAEKDFYEAVYSASKAQFDNFVVSGQVMQQFTQILALIMRLRQALCHPYLVSARKGPDTESFDELAQRCLQGMAKSGGDSAAAAASAAKYVGDLVDNLRRGEMPDCPICCEQPEDPVITPCGHVFCRECGLAAVQKLKGECAICRRPGLDKKSLRVLPGASRFPAKLTENKGVLYSSKMKALLPLLQEDMNSGRKAVVFSQWIAFLDLIFF
jgi:DNA repair protein RAD5